jgi:subtilisin family serine protease
MARSTSPFRRRFTRTAGVAAAGLAMAGAHAGAALAADGQIRGQNAANAITNNYIVVLDEDNVAKGKAKQAIDSLADEHDAKLKHRFLNSVQGFSANMSEAEALQLSKDPAVAYVEQDRKVQADASQSPTPSWGLDRIDQRDLPLNNAYSYPNGGAGVTAYIIDSGINTAHADFGGRAVSGYDAVDGGTADDCNGHGTHVAGTVGGSTYGVAKQVKLVAVRVLDCGGSGSTSAGIAALDWITAQHQAGQPAVANISIRYLSSSALDAALRRSVADGVTFAMSAGNDATSACSTRLSSLPEVLAVGATSANDTRAYFSNYGSTCVDIFAPGETIVSASHASNTGSVAFSGTSMASPHAAGAAALVLGATPTATPQQVRDQLISNASTNKVINPGGDSPNRLLFATASDGPWSGTGTATTTVTADGTAGNAVLDYSVNGFTGNWTFSNTAKSARKQPIAWRYKGYHAWFQVRVAIEQFVIRNGSEIVKQTLQSAGPVNCCAAPSGGFDYTGTATFDLQPGDIYGFRMSGSHFDSDSRLIGTLTLTS